MNRERANFRMIESELYCYQESKKDLELMREEILEGSSFQEVAVQAGLGNVTENKAIKLVSSVSIRETERRINAIEKAIDILKNSNEPRKLRLLEMKYFERRYTDTAIAEELYIDRSTFYRWRREIIELIANFLGCRV
ncbi:MAG: DUF1492 domain-containing protein [Gottschalkiaceae bacterium]|nr:MAG: DUF1492 domain-containing protein [Gottschalkiaceae bacterium]